MIYLLELKENFKKIYNKYDVYLIPATKFVLALVSFLLLNMSIGYMSKLKNPLIAVFLAVICAFLPSGFTIVALSVFMLAHLYAISAEFAAIVLCVILLMYLLYFRFTPKQGFLLIISAILCWIKMPYLIPVAVGLSAGVFSFIPVCFGIIIYFIVNTASAYETAITTQSVTDSMQQISYFVESLTSNREMLVLLIAVAVTIILVSVVRRLTINNAWTYAIIAGTVMQFIILIVGQIVFEAKSNLILIIIGTVLGALLGYVCQIVLFSVDYKRTEYVQYEDDEYYYYVKAVPKINIANADVKVKQINARNTKRTNDINGVRMNADDKNAVTLENNEEDINFFDK